MDANRTMSAIILAGGGNRRMGREKSFLLHQGRAFITSIAAQLSRVSDDVVVMTGDKDPGKFRPLVGEDVRVFRDGSFLSNPLGGILSGMDHVRHERSVVVGCDSPLVKAEVIRYLFEAIGGHAAAVPIWDKSDLSTMEPLCAIYCVPEARRAVLRALNGGRKSAKRMVALMEDVLYVDVSLLRRLDPPLDSLVDVNTREDYAALRSRAGTPLLISPSEAGTG